jgi:hypothetical protein
MIPPEESDMMKDQDKKDHLQRFSVMQQAESNLVN